MSLILVFNFLFFTNNKIELFFIKSRINLMSRYFFNIKIIQNKTTRTRSLSQITNQFNVEGFN
jgi:hypothetical protein